MIGMARSLSYEIRWATIIDVFVPPEYRGKGIGSKIIESLLE
ncbi:MAG: GNAT family N-acetyltransferase [Paraclostridium sp.]